jgi:uncharacterized OsmC-like protein
MTHINFSISGISRHASQFSATARGNSFMANDPSVLFDDENDISPMEYLLGGYAGYLNIVFYALAHRMGIGIKELKLHIEGNIHTDQLAYDTLPGITSFNSLVIVIDITTDTVLTEEFILIRKAIAAGIVTDKDGNTPGVAYKLAKTGLLN